MARYRKIDVRIWGDEKFLSLSKPQPCGQSLWFYLLTNPNTNSIPGLFRAGEAQMAEELGWSLEAFRKAFREVSAKGMAKADWKARLVWVQRAIRFNKPESPNVVTGWSVSWDELPECPLKVEAYEQLKAFTEGLPEAFAKAFVKACPKPMPNQEQEQEQEPEQERSLLGAGAPPTDSSPVLLSFKTNGKPTFWVLTQNQVDEWGALYPNLDILACCRKAYAWIEANSTKRKTAGGMPKFLVGWLNRENDSRGGLQRGGPPQSALKMIFPVKPNRTPEEEARMSEGAEIAED